MLIMAFNPLIPKRVKTGVKFSTSPNQSAGILDDYAVRKNVDTQEGTISKTPVNDTDIANKKYVDDNAGGAPKGTAVKSTGEFGGTKYLREDGDGTCSWQTPAGSGDVTASANLTDETIVQGDGGAKGVKTSTATIAQIEAAVTHYGDATGADHSDIVTAVGLNTAKETNATHTGDVTGDGALTIGAGKVTEAMQVLADNTTQDFSTAKHGYVPKGTNTGTDFLRDDATWATPAGGGDVTAAANLTDETLVQGDGGAKGVKTTTVTAAEIALNTADRHASGSDDQVAGDFNHDDLANITANEHIDWTADQGATNINAANYTDTDTTYTGGTNLTLVGTTFNVDDAFLVNDANDTTTGILTAASYVASGSSGTSAEWDTAYNHSQDNTQAHSDYLINNGADTTTGLLKTSNDQESADTEYFANILFGTDATPPAANTVARGSIYVQYTA